MGDRNQILFAQKHSELFAGPFLEVGSKDYGNTQNLRSFFGKEFEYFGVDMIPGEGVDLVLDFTDDFDVLNEKLQGRKFGTIFCLSVLEHCEQPFKMAENLTNLLRPGGCIFLSVPFSWRYHGYPSDYWRFTHEGVKKLFPRIEFELDQCVEASSRDYDFRPLSKKLGQIYIGGGAHRKEGFWFRGIMADLFKHAGSLGICRWLFAYKYVMRPTNLFMIGHLQE